MKEYKLKINGNDYNVAIESIAGGVAKVNVNGAAYDVEIAQDAPAPAAAPAPQPAAAPKAAPAPAPAAAPAPKPAAAAGGTKVSAPLPGVILAIKCKVGDAVKKGQEVMVLEAMKMENSIEASCDGTVTSVCVSQGDSVLEGADLFVIG
ncbi:MAG: acetyl-CoA carboxylase biotin carboxyl carrier protein subunit [Bacteroidales bacterium]|nr:acetyl-CoA carboxylase biotin carboxyl carrier protein subunit [Bacteroidales bacterium]